MMLQKNKSHAGKMKVVALSFLLVTSILFVQCTKDGGSSTKSKNEKLTDAEIADKLYNGEGLKLKKLAPGTPVPEPEYDVAAEFDGDLMQYLSTSIKYPKEAKAKKIEGRVIVQFTIDETGKVTDVNVLNSPDDILSRSAIEVVSKMPNWRPASKDGKPVKVQHVLPVMYKMDDTPTPKGPVDPKVSFSTKIR